VIEEGHMEQKDGAGGVGTVAREQAGQVGQTAAQAGGQVAQTTKDQATNVVGEAKQQGRDLVWEARTQVGEQAGTQKARAVDGLRSLGDELQQMAGQGGQSGIAAEVARQAATRAHGLADHLDRHEPSELLDQVRTYARRRPVVFLAGAAVLGVLAGRLTRNLASDGSGSRAGSESTALAATPPALPTSATTEAVYGSGFRSPEDEPSPGWQTGTSHQPAPGYGSPGYQPVPGYEAPGYRSAPGYQEPDYQPAPGADAAGFVPASDDPIVPGYEPVEGVRGDQQRWRTQ
jgi:hypothetical protein